MVFDDSIPPTSPFRSVLEGIIPRGCDSWMKELHVSHYYLHRQHYNYIKSSQEKESKRPEEGSQGCVGDIGPEGPQGCAGLTGPQGCPGLAGPSNCQMTNTPDAAVLTLRFKNTNQWIEENKVDLSILGYRCRDIITYTTQTSYTPKPGLDKIIALLNEMNEGEEITEDDLKYCDRNTLFFDIQHTTTKIVDEKNKDIIIILNYLELTPDKIQALGKIFME